MTQGEYTPYEPTWIGSHAERIICNECKKEQVAEVWHTDTFNEYIHICTHCGNIIMESEWQEVSDE